MTTYIHFYFISNLLQEICLHYLTTPTISSQCQKYSCTLLEKCHLPVHMGWMFSGTVKFISLRSMAYRYKYEKQRIRSDNYLNLCLLKYTNAYVSHCFRNIIYPCGDHGSTVVKVLCYNSEGRWFDPSWCQWIFHWHKILLIALWPWGRLSL